jgi:polyisoprenoid-binding protein YceI
MSVTSLSADRIPTGVYNVDPAHSSVGSAVKHMGIAGLVAHHHQFVTA